MSEMTAPSGQKKRLPEEVFKMGWHPDNITTIFPEPRSIVESSLSDIPAFKDRAFLHQKYVVEMKTCQEIAKMILCARTTVLKYLKEFDIPVREVGSNIRRKHGVAFGQKTTHREVQSHKREQNRINRLLELREKGYSYGKIADVFNTLKIPTKTRKGKWHAKSIHSIIKNYIK